MASKVLLSATCWVDILVIKYEVVTLLVFGLLLTLRDGAGWLCSVSIIPQKSSHHITEFKYRNTATSLAKSINLMFPDVNEDLCECVCVFFLSHLTEVVPHTSSLCVSLD